jgi:hypothetical protein
MALNNNKPVTKSLTFAPQIRIRSIIHIDEFTDEEVSACYYHKEEMHRVRLEVKATVQMFQVGELEKDTPHFTKRGTEYRTPDAVKRRNRNKQMAADAVFDEQEDQWDGGVLDSELLAIIYQAASSHCQVAAHNMALEYENEVNELSWSHLDCDFSDYQRKPFKETCNEMCTALQSKQVVQHRRVYNAAGA